MAFGNKVSYADTTTQIRSVIPEFDLLSPAEVPVLKWMTGGNDDKPSLNNLDAPCTQTQYEWMEDTDPAHTSTLGAAFADAVGTALNLASGIADLVEGQIILVDSEQMLVTTVTGANTATVTRGWGGTTAASHLINAVVTFVGSAHKEGADAPSAINSVPIMPYNVVQEFTKTIQLSEIEQAINRYGIDNAIEYETAKRARQLYIDMEKQLFYGKRVTATSSLPGAFGGFDTYVPAGNIIAGGSADLTGTMVMQAVQKCFDAVGMAGIPDTIVCSAKTRRKLSLLFSSYNSVVTYREQADNVGGVKVDKIVTDFGELDILVSNWCPTFNLYILKKEKLGIGPLNGPGGNKEMRREMLAKTGTSDKFMITGDYTFQMRASSMHCGVSGYILNGI